MLHQLFPVCAVQGASSVRSSLTRLGDMPFNFAQQFRSKRQSTQNIGGSFTSCWKNLVSFPLTQPSGNNHEVIFFGA